MDLAPTAKDVVYGEGTARLARFRRPNDRPAEPGAPLLLVPSLINRWYVLDLRAGSSLVEALVQRFDVWLLDWGVPEDEDRYLSWDRILSKLSRAMRRVCRETGHERVALLGYCMGGTLAGIQAALEPERVAALVNLAGPFDFTQAGMLATMVDRRWFDAQAIADAGNVSPEQMQSGFTALRPTLQLSKWMNVFATAHDPEARASFEALDAWASDNTPFPGAAYGTYISELYQQNALVNGAHWVAGRRVDLSRIRCPLLTIVAEKDNICPPEAAVALNRCSGSADQSVIRVRGGHVGAVVGPAANTVLYPAVADWLSRRLQMN